MVVGLNKFKEHFAGHQDKYAIIGGSACYLLFEQAGLNFRVTKDIDMVLCIEVIDTAFSECLRAFLDAGGYQARERSNSHKEFYRFHLPNIAGYPYMVELFSRAPETLKLANGAELAPILVDENAFSLSAILLDDDYYHALQMSKRIVDGVSIIDETLLIPFKARAYTDLTQKKASGKEVKSKDIKKHCNDVFRLAQLLTSNKQIEVSEPLRKDLQFFLATIEVEGKLDPKSFNVNITLNEAIALLRSVYGISPNEDELKT